MDLDLRDTLGLRGVPPEYARVITECASLCLDFHSHPQRVRLSVEGTGTPHYSIRWKTSRGSRRFYGDEGHNDTIRWGAECIAIHVMTRWLGLKVVATGRKGTGADFFLGLNTSDGVGFDGLVRLEVSGILDDNEGEYRERIRIKLRQLQRGGATGRAFAAVVMFGNPKTNVSTMR